MPLSRCYHWQNHRKPLHFVSGIGKLPEAEGIPTSTYFESFAAKNKGRVARLLQRIPWSMHLVQIIWRRLRQPWITVGALGAVFDDDGRLLIVEHVFHPRCPWGLPGGWMNRNEDPADTIRRELREETGLTVTVEQILLIQRTSEVRSHLDVAILCRAVPGPVTLSSELLAYRWCDPTDKANLPPLIAFHRQVISAALDARAKRLPEPTNQTASLVHERSA